VSAVVETLIASLSDDDLRALAEKLAPHMASPATVDGWLRGAEQIASYIDSPVSRVYALTSAGRIPVHRDGSALIARRSELDGWVCDGGGKRP